MQLSWITLHFALIICKYYQQPPIIFLEYSNIGIKTGKHCKTIKSQETILPMKIYSQLRMSVN